MSGADGFLRDVESAIAQELEAISTLRAEARDELARNAAHPRVLGSVLHDFYTCCERVFKRVSSEINGGHYEGVTWYRELLYRMTIPVPGLRPALVSQELAADLDEYLAFRHLFRNIYGFELKGERVVRLARGLERVAQQFEQEARALLRAIRSEEEAP
jgi:hypothetical protein